MLAVVAVGKGEKGARAQRREIKTGTARRARSPRIKKRKRKTAPL
jgi:hypothetical protein